MTKIYSNHYDRSVGNGFENVLDATAYHLNLSPAERATLLTTGSVVINDLIMEPLLIQMEQAPDVMTAGEIMVAGDYGVERWVYNDEVT